MNLLKKPLHAGPGGEAGASKLHSCIRTSTCFSMLLALQEKIEIQMCYIKFFEAVFGDLISINQDPEIY